MGFCKIFNHKLLLSFFNLMFMVSGIAVLAGGFYLFTDKKRLLLSKLLIIAPITEDNEAPFNSLPQPFFYYIAFVLTIAGFVIISISMLGCWSSYVNTYCVLTTHFLLVLMLLMLEFAVCLVVTLWPNCLGLNLNVTRMVKLLQGNYGVPGNEQFTVAMDLAQTVLECCGVNTSINYDTSLWKLQKYGKKELTVPLTCCKLMNKYDYDSYLDPQPINLTQCQSLEVEEFEKSRHLDGCAEKIEYWYREHYIIFLGAGLIIAIVEFFVLLGIVLSCTKIKQSKLKKQMAPVRLVDDRARFRESLNKTLQRTNENIYQEDFISATPNFREVYVQPPDFLKHKYPTKFKGGNSNYQISNSYLV